RALEALPTLVDEVIPDVRRAIVVAAFPGAGGALVRQLDRLARDLAFGQMAAFRNLLDDVPVSIARCEIHPAIDPARIFAQLRLDDAHRFDKLAPVHRGQEPEAADRVAHRNLDPG